MILYLLDLPKIWSMFELASSQNHKTLSIQFWKIGLVTDYIKMNVTDYIEKGFHHISLQIWSFKIPFIFCKYTVDFISYLNILTFVQVCRSPSFITATLRKFSSIGDTCSCAQCASISTSVKLGHVNKCISLNSICTKWWRYCICFKDQV